MSAHQPNDLDKYIKKMLVQGKVGGSKSPYGAPILFVPKLNGSLLLHVDYGNLNKLTIANRYPLPLMDQLQDRVARPTVFTKLELKH